MAISDNGGFAKRRRWGTISAITPLYNAGGNPANVINSGVAIEIDGGTTGVSLRFLRVEITPTVLASLSQMVLVMRGKLPTDMQFFQLSVGASFKPTYPDNPYYRLGEDLLYSACIPNPQGLVNLWPILQRKFATGYGPTVQPGEYMTITSFCLNNPNWIGQAADQSVTLTALGGPIARGSLVTGSAETDFPRARSIARGALSR